MFVRLLGKVMEVRQLQLLKALPPMLTKLLDNVTLVSELQPENILNVDNQQLTT